MIFFLHMLPKYACRNLVKEESKQCCKRFLVHDDQEYVILSSTHLSRTRRCPRSRNHFMVWKFKVLLSNHGMCKISDRKAHCMSPY